MQTMQYITCLALPVDLLAGFEQPGSCGIAFQNMTSLSTTNTGSGMASNKTRCSP